MEIHTPAGRNSDCLESPFEQNKNSQFFTVRENQAEGSMHWEQLCRSCERDCAASKIRMRVLGEEILMGLHVKVWGKCWFLFLPTKRAVHGLQAQPQKPAALWERLEWGVWKQRFSLNAVYGLEQRSWEQQFNFSASLPSSINEGEMSIDCTVLWIRLLVLDWHLTNWKKWAALQIHSLYTGKDE